MRHERANAWLASRKTKRCLKAKSGCTSRCRIATPPARTRRWPRSQRSRAESIMSSGSHYIALSGLKARADELDRLASDLANLSTAGYKGERDTTAAAERPTFDRTLQSAIDTVHGGRRVDMA